MCYSTAVERDLKIRLGLTAIPLPYSAVQCTHVFAMIASCAVFLIFSILIRSSTNLDAFQLQRRLQFLSISFGLNACSVSFEYSDTLSCQLQTHQTQLSCFLISDFNRRLVLNWVLNLI